MFIIKNLKQIILNKIYFKIDLLKARYVTKLNIKSYVKNINLLDKATALIEKNSLIEDGLYLFQKKYYSHIFFVKDKVHHKLYFDITSENTNIIKVFCEIFETEYKENEIIWFYDKYFKANIVFMNGENISDDMNVIIN